MGLQHLACERARREVHHYFYEMKTIDVNMINQFNAYIMEGILGFHQAKGVGLDKISLHVWNLFRFLRYCLDGGDGPCDNETYIALFGIVYLEPCPSNAQVDVEPMFQVKKIGRP